MLVKRLSMLLAGVQKSGTTTLHVLLDGLPELAGPPGQKELHFFDNESSIDWRDPDYRLLHDAFADTPEDALWFESTPITIFWPGALRRVRDYNPSIKLVLLFRDPVERAVSAWRMERARGVETLGFREAIAAEDRRCSQSSDAMRQFSYRKRGYYGAQLARALTLFPREQMLLLRFDDLVAAPAATLTTIADFVGVSGPRGDLPPVHLNNNARDDGLVPEPEALNQLAEDYREDLLRFRELSGLDLSCSWLSGARLAGASDSEVSG